MSVTTEPEVAPAPQRRGSGRWFLRAGIVLILAGLGVFGWIGWELYGTNVVSRHHQHQIVADLHHQWTTGGATISRTASGPASAIVHIPRFGADYEVPIIEGTSEDALAEGFGHYTGTAEPGQAGNFAIAGHRITHGEPLSQFPSLQTGDEIDIETRDATYVYRLTNSGTALVVPDTQTWVIDKLPTNPDAGGVQPAQDKGQHLLTLTTCSELFHTDNRSIAFGILVKTLPAGQLDLAGTTISAAG